MESAKELRKCGNSLLLCQSMEKEISLVIRGIGDQGTSGNVMEILGLGQPNFQRGFDLANEMQNQDLVKLLYSNFNLNKIIVEFTLLGKAAYQAQCINKN